MINISGGAASKVLEEVEGLKSFEYSVAAPMPPLPLGLGVESVPTCGREANEKGFQRLACPLPLGCVAREQWISDWNDAQITREILEEDMQWRTVENGGYA